MPHAPGRIVSEKPAPPGGQIAHDATPPFGLLSECPAAAPENQGDHYYALDTGAVLYSNGTVWTQVGGSSVDKVAPAASPGSAFTVDLSTGTVFDVTLTTANLTLTLPAPGAGKSFTLLLRQDATGSRVVTWPAAKWPGGATPTLTTTAGGVDLVSFLCVNGTDWLGFPSGYDLR